MEILFFFNFVLLDLFASFHSLTGSLQIRRGGGGTPRGSSRKRYLLQDSNADQWGKNFTESIGDLDQKRQDAFYGCEKDKKTSWFSDLTT